MTTAQSLPSLAPFGLKLAIGPIAERVAGLSETVMFVSLTVPSLQTRAEMGTCTTHPPGEEQDNPGPGATQAFTMLTDELTVRLHDAEAVLSESTVLEPKVLLAVAWLVTASEVVVNWTE